MVRLSQRLKSQTSDHSPTNSVRLFLPCLRGLSGKSGRAWKLIMPEPEMIVRESAPIILRARMTSRRVSNNSLVYNIELANCLISSRASWELSSPTCTEFDLRRAPWKWGRNSGIFVSTWSLIQGERVLSQITLSGIRIRDRSYDYTSIVRNPKTPGSPNPDSPKREGALSQVELGIAAVM